MDPARQWIADHFQAARAFLDDTILFGVAAFFIMALFIAWSLSARRSRVLRRANAKLEAELAEVRSALDGEVRWRRSAERLGAQTTKPT